MTCYSGTKWRLLGFVLLVVGGVLTCQKILAKPTSEQISTPIAKAGLHNESSVITVLWPVLKNSGKVARIYYTASCPSDADYFPYYPYPFPVIPVHAPPDALSGLAAVRYMFGDVKKITIEEQPVGVIRIRIGQISDTILKTHISQINLKQTLKQEAQYTPLFAIYAIEGAKEVQDAMRDLHIQSDSRPYIQLMTEPSEKLPHLPEALSNVTMDQALDLVAQTFGGIVEYGTCEDGHPYTILFTGGDNFYISDLPP